MFFCDRFKCEFVILVGMVFRLFNHCLLFVFLLLIILWSAEAARLYGNIYDIELNDLKNSVVEINTTPKQRFVAKDGAYTFTLPKGVYVLRAEYNGTGAYGFVEEIVKVEQEGNFVYDLFLFPGLNDDEIKGTLDEDINGDTIGNTGDLIVDSKESNNYYVLFVIVLGVVVLVLLYFFVYVSKKKLDKVIEIIRKLVRGRGFVRDSEKVVAENAQEMGQDDRGKRSKRDVVVLSEELQQVVDIIQKQGGRVTQKEIRKEIPMSEAKISLMITELEDKGVVNRIKKGRGNIIVLK